MKHLVLLLSLSIMTVCCFGQTNDDNAFIGNSYGKKTIEENGIDTICVTIDLSGRKAERFYAFDRLGNLTYKDTVVYQYDESSKLILVQKGRDTEKYRYVARQ